jgi:hypothetical protein
MDNRKIIHSRWNSDGSKPGLIGSNNSYDHSIVFTSATNPITANTYPTAIDVAMSNIRSESISGLLVRIYALKNLGKITVSDFWIEEFGSCGGHGNPGVSESFMSAMTDG